MTAEDVRALVRGSLRRVIHEERMSGNDSARIGGMESLAFEILAALYAPPPAAQDSTAVGPVKP